MWCDVYCDAQGTGDTDTYEKSLRSAIMKYKNVKALRDDLGKYLATRKCNAAYAKSSR